MASGNSKKFKDVMFLGKDNEEELITYLAEEIHKAIDALPEDGEIKADWMVPPPLPLFISPIMESELKDTSNGAPEETLESAGCTGSCTHLKTEGGWSDCNRCSSRYEEE